METSQENLTPFTKNDESSISKLFMDHSTSASQSYKSIQNIIQNKDSLDVEKRISECHLEDVFTIPCTLMHDFLEEMKHNKADITKDDIKNVMNAYENWMRIACNRKLDALIEFYPKIITNSLDNAYKIFEVLKKINEEDLEKHLEELEKLNNDLNEIPSTKSSGENTK